MLYRDCICSIETTQCLCVAHTQCRVAGGWGSRTTPTPHWGFPVPTHTHTQNCYPAAAGGQIGPKGEIALKGPSWVADGSQAGPWLVIGGKLVRANED